LRTLFVSGHFLHPGSNEITLLELQKAPDSPTVSTSDKIIESAPIPFAVRLDRAAVPHAPTTP
jgi:hypothetical protein